MIESRELLTHWTLDVEAMLGVDSDIFLYNFAPYVREISSSRRGNRKNSRAFSANYAFGD